MSLIETALGKARSSAGNRSSASPVRRPALEMPSSRVAVNPQLRITKEMLQQLGARPVEEVEHQHASEYRHIKRQVVTEIRENPAERVVLIASALAGEGKSFTAINLARSLAKEPDYTVLLVDADAVKPALTRALQLTDRPGLMNALADESRDIESLVISTDIEGLSVLPAGSASENATEYFASERMRQLLERLVSVPNRIVVIDSLPLLLTTEARALAPLASQLLLVVRADVTPQGAIRHAIGLIPQGVNVKLLLNAVQRTRLTQYLGDGYGFDYSYLPHK